MADRLLTYPELAEILGRSEEAARQLAKRRRWRRSISNEDGRARVSVPVEFLEAPRPPVDPRSTDQEADQSAGERPGDDQAVDRSDDQGFVSIFERHISRLEAEIDALREEREAERARAKGEADELRAERDAERLRAAQVDALNAVLTAERRGLEEARAADGRRLDDLKAERDRWAGQAERLAEPVLEAPRRSWWPFRRAG